MKRSIRRSVKAGRKATRPFRKNLQSFCEFKRRKENERRNNVLRFRRLQLARNALVKAVISILKMLVNFFNPKPTSPEPAAPAVAKAA